jgi:hypothetical protein
MTSQLAIKENRLHVTIPGSQTSQVLGIPLGNFYQCVYNVGIKSLWNGVGGGAKAYEVDVRSTPTVYIGHDTFDAMRGDLAPNHYIKVYKDRIEAHGRTRYSTMRFPKHNGCVYKDDGNGNASVLLTLDPEWFYQDKPWAYQQWRQLRILIKKDNAKATYISYYG